MSRKTSAGPHLLNGEEIIGNRSVNVVHKRYTGESVVHWHDYYELEMICSGEGSYEVNGRRVGVSRCSAYLVTPQDYHRLCAENTDMYTISFSGAAVDWEIIYKINECQSGLVVRFSEEEFEMIERVLSHLTREFDSKLPMRENALKNLLEYILVCLLRQPGIAGDGKGELSTAVMKAVTYIKNNFKENLTLKSVAEKVDISPNYLGVLLRKEMNTTFSQYLTLTRLKYARNLLRDKHYRVEDIAYASGFVSHAYFSAVFKKEYGCTPQQMRKMMEE